MSVSSFAWKKLRQKNWEMRGLWRLGLAIASVISGVSITSSVDCVFAQIIPDGTLQDESSQVIELDPSLVLIEGGATRSTNLFHSFDQFSIPTDVLVYFNNTPAIQNIISRVTGSSLSSIDGSIAANGPVNLFLINPNGIIFGPNASVINVGGSFVATTANAIQFGDQGFFSASVPNVPPPLLTVNPSAFLFNQITAQPENSIIVQAKLSVPDGRSLLLVGGNVSPTPSSTGGILIDGGMNGDYDALAAPDGRVEVGGVAEPGTVGLDIDGNILRLSFPDGLALADVLLTNQANISANVINENSGIGGGAQLQGRHVTLTGRSRITAQTSTNQDGGDITIRASQLILQDGSLVSASTSSEGQGGRVTVNVSEFVELSGTDAEENSSGLFSNSYTAGDAGELTIETGRLILRDGARVMAATADGTEGQGGTLLVIASESVELSGTRPDGYPSRLSTQTNGTGDAGHLTIFTRRLSVQDGGQVSAITLGTGQGGTLTVNASELVQLSGTTITPEGVFAGGLATETINVLTPDTGDAGALTIFTRQLIVRDGANVTSATRTRGSGGPLTVNASESIDLSSGGRLTTQTRTAADAGDLTINTGRLNVWDRGLVSASTSGEGAGGSLTVNASDSVALSGNGLLSVATTGAGAAGNLTITTRQLSAQDTAQISASTSRTGTPGNIFVREADSVSLSNNSSISTAVNPGAVVNAAGAEQFGDIDIQTRLLSLTNGASVSASTSGQGDAGSIFVRDADAVSLSNSSISTAVNAGAVGRGGGIDIQTGSLSLDSRAQVSAATSGTGRAGSISVREADSVSLANGSTISTAVNARAVVNPTAEPQRSNIDIQTRTLGLTNGASVSASTSGQGDAGSIFVRKADSVSLSNSSISTAVNAGAIGRGGSIDIQTGLLSLDSGAQVSAATSGTGNAGSISVQEADSVSLANGSTISTAVNARAVVNPTAEPQRSNIDIQTRTLGLTNGASVSASTSGQGDAGSIFVRNADAVSLFNGSISTAVNTGAVGQGGNIDVQTDLLALDNNAQISAATSGTGDAGSILVRDADAVSLSASTMSTATSGASQAGDLTINTGQLTIQDRGQVSAATSGSGDGGSVQVNASESVSLNSQGRLLTQSSGTGVAGDVTLTTPQLTLQSGAEIAASTTVSQGGNVKLDGLETLQVRNSRISASTEEGIAGNVTVNATQSVQLSGTLEDGTPGGLLAEATEGGNARNLTINTRQLRVEDGAQATVSSTGTGTAGNLDVTADDVILNNQARLTAETESGSGGNITLQGLNRLQVRDSLISASTEDGTAGNVSVNAIDSVQLEGTLADGRPGGLLAEATEGGNARNLTINTRQLSVSNGAQATVSSTDSGIAGNLDVTADDVILNNQARLTAETQLGGGGNITLRGLDNLQVRDSLISASTQGGTAGDVSVNASDSVQLIGNSRLAVEATSGGTAGNLTVKTGQLSVRDGALVTVSSPKGQAGNLSVTANSLSLNRGSLTAETAKSGAQGGANITLDGLDFVFLQNESLISANALEDANGGNINIGAKFIIALPPTRSQGSDIVANAFRGNGGRVNITAQGLFGIEFRPLRTRLNDITASSEFGSAGVVAIDTPNVDPSRGLSNLPTDFGEPPMEDSCRADGKTASSFVVTGRGGLPPSPYDTLSSDLYLVSLATPVRRTEYRPNPTESTNSTSPTPNTIVEAQGWIIAADGTVTLTAQVPTATPHSPAFTSANCQAQRERAKG